MAKTTKPTRSEVEGILRKPYSIDLVYGDTPEDGVVAKVAEWPGCMTAGDTREEALAHIGDAMRDWVEARLEDGLDIPGPTAAFSGRLLLRLPRDLHRDADRRAKAEGVSLNQWLGTAIARELGPIKAEAGVERGSFARRRKKTRTSSQGGRSPSDFQNG